MRIVTLLYYKKRRCGACETDSCGKIAKTAGSPPAVRRRTRKIQQKNTIFCIPVIALWEDPFYNVK